MTNSELCFDAWVVRKLAMDNFSTEHWDNVDAINYLRAAVIELMSMVKFYSNAFKEIRKITMRNGHTKISENHFFINESDK
jgi:hypothetical protein